MSARSASVLGRSLISRAARCDLTGKLCYHQRTEWRYGAAAAQQHLHTFARGMAFDDDEKECNRKRLQSLPATAAAATAVVSYHTSPANEKAVAIILGLGAVSATSYAASSAIKAWKEYKASLPEEPIVEEKPDEARNTQQATDQKQENAQDQAKTKDKANESPRENIFKKWFGVGVGSKYYEGGFEETMTRREAALILGVRESSSPKRIKDAHRKLLILNHPDTGGSTYLAGKLNEAKELLLKGRRS